MNFSAPTQVFFFASLALVVLGLLGSLGNVAQLAPYSMWLMLAGYAVLAFGCLFKRA